MEKQFKFTSENLIENLHKVGAWSSYGLASIALQHYFPDEYDEDGYCEISIEVGLLYRLKLDSWQDVIEKYHKEVGYKAENGFRQEFVNEF